MIRGPTASSRRLALGVALVLLSAAGVLVAGGIGLWRAARDGRALATAAGEQAVLSAARALQSWLHAPERLALPDDDPTLFELRDGAVTPPAALVPWPADPIDPELDLAPQLLPLLDAADVAEARGDVAAAKLAFEQALARVAASAPRQRAFLLHALARMAGRSGDTATRDAAERELRGLLAAAISASASDPPTAAPLDPDRPSSEPVARISTPAPHYAVVIAGALAAALERADPEALALFLPFERPLGALPLALRDALAAEFATPRAADESRSSSAIRVELASALGRMRARDELAARVAPHVARLAAATAPVAIASGHELLLFRPGAVGRGALRLATQWLPVSGEKHEAGSRSARVSVEVESPGIGRVWSSADPAIAPGGPVTLAIGDPLPVGALAVLPGFGVLPLGAPQASLLASSGGLAASLGALGATLIVTLLLLVRGLRRDTAANAARTRFLTSVTHELKTPLASIRLLSELLTDGRTGAAKQDEYHRLLAGEAERLSALIENVLDAGALDRGERALHLEPQRLDLLLDDVVERVAPLLARDGVVVEWRSQDAKPAAELASSGASPSAVAPNDSPIVPPIVPLLARVDRGAFAQVVINLLDNARKYAASGGRVRVELLASPAADAATATIVLRVRDFGPGVAPADRAALFEPFTRGAAQADGATPGLGLGLHLARTLARRQGGELALCAPDDGGPGACFEWTLPAASPADRARDEMPAAGAIADVAGAEAAASPESRRVSP